jgi:hypothetical protein
VHLILLILALSVPGWRRQEIRLPGEVWTVAPADENGDGRTDLVVAHGSAEGRRIAVFHQGESGYPEEPDRSYLVPEGAVALLVEDLREGGGAEVATIHPDRVILHEPGPAFPVWIEVESFFRFAPEEGLPRWDLVAEMDGDPFREVVVPDTYGYRILGLEGVEPGKIPRLRAPTTARIDPIFPSGFQGKMFIAEGALPRPVLRELDGKGGEDLAFADGGSLRAFLRDGEGRFPLRTDLVEEITPLEELGEGALGEVRLQLRDLSGDGKADLMVTRVIGEIGLFETLRTHVAIFLGDGSGKFPATPDQILLVKGVSIDPEIIDFDGDGDRDIFVSALRTDLLTNIKNVMIRWVAVTYHGYANDGEGRFSRDPAITWEVEIPVGSIEQGRAVPFAWFRGDFDGDGRRDVLSVKGTDEAAAYPGGWDDDEYVFDDEDPIFQVPGPTSNRVQILDLTGDGRSDVILQFPRNQEMKDAIALILSPRKEGD